MSDATGDISVLCVARGVWCGWGEGVVGVLAGVDAGAGAGRGRGGAAGAGLGRRSGAGLRRGGRKSDEWGFWEFLSWENADKYHADLIMIDNRSTSLSAEELAEKRTWRQLPAVKAGQTVPWAMEERYGYAGYAPVLEQLADAVRKAGKLSA
ncbi:hypothetical protein [Streptomyces sp. Y7]|uniref:hypothetical protein n=1 Tax=Streptomyces sp. Y7 TaxID=3342392 RepID=UPI003724B68C